MLAKKFGDDDRRYALSLAHLALAAATGKCQRSRKNARAAQAIFKTKNQLNPETVRDSTLANSGGTETL